MRQRVVRSICKMKHEKKRKEKGREREEVEEKRKGESLVQ
jgi:hypothetical protein